MKVDVCIVGGGICGVLAAHGCIERGLSFVLLEKNSSLGGCWQTLANDHSTLQVGLVEMMINLSFYGMNSGYMYPGRLLSQITGGTKTIG